MTKRQRKPVIDTNSVEWIEASYRQQKYRYKDLSGDHLGARIEELPPGHSSSFHHFHTSEEEHVLVLKGKATLKFGDDELSIKAGDHLCFFAGDETAHHIKNNTNGPCSYLVYGERKNDDVVVYPDAGVMLIKSLGGKQFTYRAIPDDDADDA